MVWQGRLCPCGIDRAIYSYENIPSMVEKHPARRKESHPSRGTGEELGTGLFLQRSDLPTEGWRYVKAPRGAPHVFGNSGRRGTGMVLEPGMAITVEPMINLGVAAVRLLDDGWTIVTADESLSAQWGHPVVVTRTGYEILTLF